MSLVGNAYLPLSPPAPHRRAPQPPKPSPKKLGRHIDMKEPSQCGLFTVSEVPEMTRASHTAETSVLEYLSAMSCSGSARSSFDSGDESMTDGDLTFLQTPDQSPVPPRRSSWSSSEGDESQIVTPLLGDTIDPFLIWSSVSLDDKSDTGDDDYVMAISHANHFTCPSPSPKSSCRTRRAPPPLTLKTRFSLPPFSASLAATPTLSAHPYSAASTCADSELLTPLSTVSTSSTGLMPALPIVAPVEWAAKRGTPTFGCPASPTTPTKSSARSARSKKRHSSSDNVDLASALEELMASCGEAPDSSASETESDVDSKSLCSPLQPTPTASATPTATASGALHTPEKRPKRSPAPYAPRKPCRPHPHAQLPTRRRESGGGSGGLSPSSLEGDHSFLNYLARSESPASPESLVSGKWSGKTGSTGSSSGSWESGNVPARSGLPLEWRFGQMI